jgi:hypothetical protein
MAKMRLCTDEVVKYGTKERGYRLIARYFREDAEKLEERPEDTPKWREEWNEAIYWFQYLTKEAQRYADMKLGAEVELRSCFGPNPILD